jgi:hypothetical protein
MHRLLPALLVPLALSPLALAGPYDGAAESPGSLAVPLDSTEIVAWATGHSELVRGPAWIEDLSFGNATHGTPDLAYGPAGTDVFHTVSLGDGGRMTLTFAQPITNGPGWDFTVFENSFSDSFLELAFVEVSSDGANFFRFNSVSLTQTSTQMPGFGATLDPTDLFNLAGKYRGGFGTRFDLAELASAGPLLDISSVTHVRVTDVVGSLNPLLGSLDSLGNLINDPFATPFATGGFDLDAIGVRHVAIPEPSHAALLLGALALAALALRRRF